MTGHVVIATDKFKGSLGASEVTEAIATGLRQHRQDLDLRKVPVADGGDGTVAVALAGGHRRVPVRATGPTGTPVHTEIAVDGDTAVVELAAASGIALLDDELAPMTASSYGTGELITAALDAGARTIVLGVGGSACTDGGAGMLAALGARIVDDTGTPLPLGGGALAGVSSVDLSALDSRVPGTRIVLASDVDNPLLGERGAAHVYGPQKGADADQVELLDAALRRWSDAVITAGGTDATSDAGAGAAGGVGFAALAALGAHCRSGVDVLCEITGLDGQLPGARLVITGEGSLDEQTLHGKAPAGVAERAVAAGVPVVAVAGRCVLPAARLRATGFAGVYALSDLEPDAARSMREAAPLLASLGARIAAEWL